MTKLCIKGVRAGRPCIVVAEMLKYHYTLSTQGRRRGDIRQEHPSALSAWALASIMHWLLAQNDSNVTLKLGLTGP